MPEHPCLRGSGAIKPDDAAGGQHAAACVRGGGRRKLCPRRNRGGASGRLLQSGVPLDNELNRSRSQQPRHPGEHVELRALDVDLDEVRIAVDERVERRDGHPINAGDARIDALRKEGRFTALTSPRRNRSRTS